MSGGWRIVIAIKIFTRSVPPASCSRECTMSKKVAIFWPGDYRAKPNEWALPQSREATEQLAAALKKLGRSPYLVEGYLTRPDEAIAKLGSIDDPLDRRLRPLDLRARTPSTASWARTTRSCWRRTSRAPGRGSWLS